MYHQVSLAQNQTNNIALITGLDPASSLAQYQNLARDKVEPRKTIVEGVKWIEGRWMESDGKKKSIEHSRLLFPNSFDGEIETDVIQGTC